MSLQEYRLRIKFSVPKDERYPNEDSHQCSKRRGIFALSDGASVSYDSALWSRILVRHYCIRPEIDQQWLTGAIAEFSRIHNRDSLPWMMQAAFDRGSFASLLGVRYEQGGTGVQVFAVGDSLAVLCEGDKVVDSWPYKDASQFARDPQLISTNPEDNNFLFQEETQQRFKVNWDLVGMSAPAVFCMTDALGCWLLARRDEAPSPVTTLRSLSKRREFGEFVRSEHDAGRLKRDDTTVLGFW